MAEATSGAGLRNLPGRAIIYLLTSSFLLVVLDTAVKWLAKGYSPLQIGFLRYLMGLGIAAGIAAQNGGLVTLRTRRLVGHLLRSVLNLTTMLTFYYALRLIPLADAIAIGFASPLFTTALSVPMLKERVGPRRWAAVALGLVGVLLIVQPTGHGTHVGALLALVSALCWSLTLISSRQLSGTEPSHTILFYYSLAVVIGLGATMPTVWIMPEGLDWLWFAVCGIAGSLGQYCVNQAYRYGEASMVAPLDYTSLIWATLAGYIVFGQLPTAVVLGGAAIIITSSLYIARRETLRARARQVVGPGPTRPGPVLRHECRAMKNLRHAPLRGVLYMLGGVASFSAMDATVKWLTKGYPLSQLIFVGRLPLPFFAVALALAAGGLRTLQTRDLRWHALRAFASAVTMVAFFWALRLLPLADTIAICFVSPLIQSALSVVLLGERVGPRRWFAIGVGFLGVIVIVQPSGTGFGLGPTLALISAVSYAFTNNISRRISGTDTTQGMMLWYAVLILLGSGVALPFQWTPVRGEDALVFVLYALSGTLGQFLVFQAFRYGEASLLAPVDYSALIWATLFGFLFWGQFPTPAVLVGAAIIIASSLYVLHRETRRSGPPPDQLAPASRLPET